MVEWVPTRRAAARIPTETVIPLTRPLDGIKVLDLTRVLAGPFCTMILADLGAEVIKVERGGAGDDTRAFGPFVKGESAYFMSVNRGKKSVTLDMKDPRGKDLLRRLAKRCDVLVENFKPGVMARLGLGYPDLAKINPKLIYCASSGFGQTGPYSDRPAYDLIIQGMGGMMSITGPDAKHPTKVGSSIADILAGMFSAIGILAALHVRKTTKRGQMVDVAMLDAMVAVLENAIARAVASGENPVPIGNRHPSIAPFSTFETADGAINIACGNDELWKRCCNEIGLPELGTDPRFDTNPKRVDRFDELIPLVAPKMRARSTKEWLARLQGAGIPAGPLNTIRDVLADPHVLARDMLVELTHPVAGRMKVPGVPMKFSDTPATISAPAPTLGQHNDEIYGGMLRVGKAKLAELKADRVI